MISRGFVPRAPKLEGSKNLAIGGAFGPAFAGGR
jgi:hypothetical protein